MIRALAPSEGMRSTARGFRVRPSEVADAQRFELRRRCSVRVSPAMLSRARQSPSLNIGDVLSVSAVSYRLLGRPGAGGMGEVFLAHRPADEGNGRSVALKRIDPALPLNSRAASFCRSFAEDAAIAATLRHPNICQVFELLHHETLGPIQVLEYIPGHTLKELIAAAVVV